MAKSKSLEEATKSLERIQGYEVEKLARKSDLGGFSFETFVGPARRLANLFKTIPVSVLEELPDGQLNNLRQYADNLYSQFERVLQFNPDTENLGQFRNDTLGQLVGQYEQIFTQLHPFISFAASRATDISRLEAEARAAVQSISDRTEELLAQITAAKQTAEEGVQAIRTASAEAGVAKQAYYFKAEAELHTKEAEVWRKRTVKLAWAMATYAIMSIGFHKIEWLTPSTIIESTQLITSKILLFAVIAYMLVLSAKNFLSNRHNAIVNKHRENALLTFEALAVAARDQTATDIILSHAAACIFAPQETGYSKTSSGPEPSAASSIINLVARTDRGSGTGTG